MDLHLKDKVVLVTGGATGLGRSIVTILAEEGAKVVVNYRSREEEATAFVKALATKFGVKCIAVYADVASESDVKAMFERAEAELGPVDALVNNAAYCANPPCTELDIEEFQKCVDVNLKGMFLHCREMVWRLLARKSPGKIVNISSQAALRGSQTGKTAYDMTKAGILGFTRSLALEVGSHGINVNAVLPGLMYTEMLAKQPSASLESYNKRPPLGRVGQTDEIAQVVVFLCSDRASYMAGASVDVSGGIALH